MITISDYSTEQRGWIYVIAISAYCMVLHKILPPFQAEDGYACDCKTKKILTYRFNGFYTLVVIFATFYYLVTIDLFDLCDFSTCYWPMFRASFTLGLAISLYLYFRGVNRLQKGLVDRGTSCLTKNLKRTTLTKSTKEFDNRSTLESFYCGIEWNPRVWNIDIKMFNYLIGAVLLACNVVSAVATHASKREHNLDLSNSMYAYLIPMCWFISEYLWFENVHVYTYDIFRERTGFKMCWGCWFFYPFFYCIGIWPIVTSSVDISKEACIGCILVFYSGWVLTRGANLQKFSWRHKKSPTFLGIQNQTVPGSDGRLLVSGWWGIARHINYTGEIIQGIGLALPAYLCSGSYLSFLYPLYYVLLFVGRDQDDDKGCKEKYGASWDRYVRKVPYRMLPGIY